ncbi:MAG: penicillin-binding transpeptidase domain-containing protein, partial [Pseudomonadota bacterium]
MQQPSPYRETEKPGTRAAHKQPQQTDRSAVTISAGLQLAVDQSTRSETSGATASRRQDRFTSNPQALRTRALTILALTVVAFGGIAIQAVHLGGRLAHEPRAASNIVLTTTRARPDIVDRHGRLLAKDVVMPSVFADPSRLIDPDATAVQLAQLIPSIDSTSMAVKLKDKTRQFVWIKRGVSPAIAEAVHNLGNPGLSFRDELKRAYPSGKLAGHILGSVDIDNNGLSGIEQHLDRSGLTKVAHVARLSTTKPVVLSLDQSIQHALEDELTDAAQRYKAAGAMGAIIDIANGEILAAASFPLADPAQPSKTAERGIRDHLLSSSFELGSVFKVLTIAKALNDGSAFPLTQIDVRKPIRIGDHELGEKPTSPPSLTVTQVFARSSNLGAAILALAGGGDSQSEFFDKLGLKTPLSLEAGQ